jgi:hypothetical protein
MGLDPQLESAREEGMRLLGPPFESLIPPIPRAELIEEVRQSLARRGYRIPGTRRPGRGRNAILAMCRGLHAIRLGGRPSKLARAR